MFIAANQSEKTVDYELIGMLRYGEGAAVCIAFKEYPINVAPSVRGSQQVS